LIALLAHISLSVPPMPPMALAMAPDSRGLKCFCSTSLSMGIVKTSHQAAVIAKAICIAVCRPSPSLS